MMGVSMSAGPPTCRARHSVSAVWRCEVRSLLDQGLGGKQDKAGTSAVPALAARALALAGSWKAGKTHGLSASLFQSLSDQDGSPEVNRCVFRPPETQGLGGGYQEKGVQEASVHSQGSLCHRYRWMPAHVPEVQKEVGGAALSAIACVYVCAS